MDKLYPLEYENYICRFEFVFNLYIYNVKKKYI